MLVQLLNRLAIGGLNSFSKELLELSILLIRGVPREMQRSNGRDRRRRNGRCGCHKSPLFVRTGALDSVTFIGAFAVF
jgi:hypothetical protein